MDKCDRNQNRGGGRIEVYFETSDSLKEYFTGKQFFCEYSEPIETVPQAVAVIPFIVNVLPIVWLFNAELHLPELEKNFFESIDNIKSGYKNMYPEAMFLGKIKVDNIVDCSYVPSRKCSSFFSGGLDAIHTLIRHAEEKPDLITIWGSDLGLNDTAGWENVKSAVEDFGNIFNLKNVYIKSSFTEFIEERKLSYKFWNVIHGLWYHNIQHGIGMLGLTAPYVYKNKICTHYIGSSYSGKNKVECASDPTIDNQLKLASCKIVHDAYGYTRQDKIKEVIDYSKKTGINIPLRVCWTIKDGTNCCNCEKCFRTITGLLIEGADPKKYNFNTSEPIYKSLKKYMTIKHQCDSVTLELWHDIQERFYKNKKELRRNHILYKYIRWIDGFDFSNIKNNKEYKLYRLKGKFFSIVCKLAPRSITEFAKKYINIYDN